MCGVIGVEQQEREKIREVLQLDYYYGIEAEQFSFYRIPRLLIKDERFKKLSSDAKLLYGLMLDRMSMSMKNGWFDEENRAYIIYTIDSIMEDLGCGKDKAVKILAELDSVKGIGLVEKVRRGLGKPAIIYVKNFATLSNIMDEKEPANADKITEVGKSNFKKSENRTSGSQKTEPQEVRKTEFKKSEKPTLIILTIIRLILIISILSIKLRQRVIGWIREITYKLISI